LAEKVIGEVLDRTKMRKDVYLVTKNNHYDRAEPGELPEATRRQPRGGSRPSTSIAINLHGVSGGTMKALKDPGVKAIFEEFKKAGKIRFCGLSCHDARLPRSSRPQPKSVGSNQVMFKYNFRDVGKVDRTTTCNARSTKASKANLGLVANEDPRRCGQLPREDEGARDKALRRKSPPSKPSGWTTECRSW